jgi:hypothetical protein
MYGGNVKIITVSGTYKVAVYVYFVSEAVLFMHIYFVSEAVLFMRLLWWAVL